MMLQYASTHTIPTFYRFDSIRASKQASKQATNQPTNQLPSRSVLSSQYEPIPIYDKSSANKTTMQKYAPRITTGNVLSNDNKDNRVAPPQDHHHQQTIIVTEIQELIYSRNPGSG